MHATHQFFLTKRSLYLLVLDARRDDEANRLDYWLQKINSFGGDSPILIVGNATDEQPFQYNERFYREKYGAQIIGWFPTSCLSGDGILALRTTIENAINTLLHVHDTFPKNWFTIKQQLVTLNDQYIKRHRYTTICHDHELRDEQGQKLLLRFLHDLGIALNYADERNQLIDQTHILNPEWVTAGVYKLINDRDLIREQGCLTETHLTRTLAALSRETAFDYTDMHDYILYVMERFRLCYPASQAGQGRVHLVPSLFKLDEPDTGEWEETLRFQYHYPNAFEPSVMTQLIAELHPLISANTYWRTGVVLKDDEHGNRARIRADREQKLIEVRVDGGVRWRRAFLTTIRNGFQTIHRTIPHLLYEERIPMPDNPAVTYPYAHLIELEREGETEVRPPYAKRPYTIAELLDGIEDAQTRAVRAERMLLDRGEHGSVRPEAIPPAQTIALTPTPEPEPTPQKQENGWRIAFSVFLGFVVTALLLLCVQYNWWRWDYLDQHPNKESVVGAMVLIIWTGAIVLGIKKWRLHALGGGVFVAIVLLIDKLT